MQRDGSRGVWRLALAAVLVAAAASADPTQVKCGPAQAGCGPAAVLGTTTSTTLPGAPSWVSSMLAAWMLDEPSGTRVNAQGVTTRNLTETGGPILNDTTNKMEGTAAVAALTGTQNLLSTDATLVGLPAPFTCGAWARPIVAGATTLIGTNNSFTNGFVVQHNSDLNWQWECYPNATMYFQSNTAANTWAHIVVRQTTTTSTAFKNGASVQSAARAFVPSTGSSFVVGGRGGGAAFQGQIDEAWCIGSALADTSICRICSCGLRGEQCACNGAVFTSTGRNATACGSCALPANCSAAAPS